MGKFINEKSLSVGYNNGGQEFFDELKKHESFIHSYFFSLTEDMKGGKFDTEKVIRILKDSDTYNIPANLLFNIRSIDESIIESSIERIMGDVNLEAVTVTTPDFARFIKEKYPALKVHLSVRFYDWARMDFIQNSYPNGETDKIAQLPLMRDVIDVINVSGRNSYNDLALIEACHENGIKTKFIINEGCITRNSRNYKNFPGFENTSCSGSPCGRVCDDVTDVYPWMDLARINFFKESLQFFKHDILKISTRCNTMKGIKNILSYWTSDIPTQYVGNIPIEPSTYPVFIEYLEARSTCSNSCWECRKCEDFYNRLNMD